MFTDSFLCSMLRWRGLKKGTYFASSVKAMRPEAIAAAAEVPPKLSTHPGNLSAVI